jgi:hypothetical protein
VGFTPAEQLRAIIHQIGAATEAPFNVNFITYFDNNAQIRVCAEEKVPVASFHWGHPSRQPKRSVIRAGMLPILSDIPRMAEVTCDRMGCSSFVGKAERQLWRSRGALVGQPSASYSAAADRGLRPRRFGDGATTSGAGVDTTACRGLRPKPSCFAIVERRSE